MKPNNPVFQLLTAVCTRLPFSNLNRRDLNSLIVGLHTNVQPNLPRLFEVEANHSGEYYSCESHRRAFTPSAEERTFCWRVALQRHVRFHTHVR